MGEKSILRIMLLLIFVSISWSLSSVYGYWAYGEKVDISQERVLTIKYFPWEGEDILPDDGDTEDGETSQREGMDIIIKALNNEALSGDSKLNAYISKRVQNFNKIEYGSVDVKQDVASLLDDIADVFPNYQFILHGNVVGSGKNKYVEYFYLYMVDNSVYNAAMQAWEDSGISEGDYQDDPSIFSEYFYPVNRVKIEKNAYDEWAASIAEVGYTGYGYYEGSNNGGGQKVWTFYVSSWEPGNP